MSCLCTCVGFCVACTACAHVQHHTRASSAMALFTNVLVLAACACHQAQLCEQGNSYTESYKWSRRLLQGSTCLPVCLFLRQLRQMLDMCIVTICFYFQLLAVNAGQWLEWHAESTQNQPTEANSTGPSVPFMLDMATSMRHKAVSSRLQRYINALV